MPLPCPRSFSRPALATLLGVLALTTAACNKSDAGVAQPGKNSGEVTYGRRCETCHQSEGQGSGSSWPPLAASPWLLRDHETPIRIVLLGVQGEMTVNGVTFGNVMPNQGVVMSDREIADVLTFTRSAWGNGGDPILESEVAAVRASLAGRTTPWTARELEALRAK